MYTTQSYYRLPPAFVIANGLHYIHNHTVYFNLYGDKIYNNNNNNNNN